MVAPVKGSPDESFEYTANQPNIIPEPPPTFRRVKTYDLCGNKGVGGGGQDVGCSHGPSSKNQSVDWIEKI